MSKISLTSDLAKDVVIDLMFCSDYYYDKHNLVNFWSVPVELKYKYEYTILESESGRQEDWEEYDSNAQEAYSIVEFKDKHSSRDPVILKFYGTHRSHDGTYFEGIKELKRVTKVIHTYE